MIKGRLGVNMMLLQSALLVFSMTFITSLDVGFLNRFREAMRFALAQEGLRVETEVAVPVSFRGRVVGIFRADLIVNDAVLIELKACDQIIRQHEAQTMHYLRSTQIEVGLLMNFGPVPRLKRFVMDNELKTPKHKSAESVTIGFEPFVAPEMIP